MGYVRGKVQHILFQAGTYNVFKFEVLDTDFPYRDPSTTVSGHLVGISGLKSGTTIHLIGEWVNHAKFGRQFSPRSWQPWAATTTDISNFLDRCLVIGGLDIVESIVSAFGLDTFEVFNERPEEILNLAGGKDEDQDRYHHAVQVWQSARGLSDLSVFLQDYGLGPETVAGIYAKFGDKAQEIIASNPYRLVVVPGFSFGRADRLANQLDIPRDDPRRVEGAVLWALKEEARDGHLYMRRGELPDRMVSLTEREKVDPFNIDDLYKASMEAAAKLIKEGGLHVDTTAGLYLPDLYRFERESAKKLVEFLSPSEIQVDLDKFLSDYEKSNQIELSDAQQDAVRKLVHSRVLVVTGLPGTGKTTLVRTFVRLFKDAGLHCMLMAPTGIAAKRLAAVTEEEAQTVHRALGYNGTEWQHDDHNKLGAGAVIVDEMSMVDQELIYRLLTALHPSTMLVMVGDDAQLPSVGPGNVLREMVSCKDLPRVRLTQIFRQAHTSDIVLASHKINSGDNPLPETRNPDSEFQFVAVTDEDKIVEIVVEMASKLKGRDENFQVLSPKHLGAVGVRNLNQQLRDRLNPEGPQREWKSGLLHVREGDRLMVVKNNYKLNVYNGDMGKLISITKDSLMLRIHGVGRTPDTVVHISKDSAPMTLRLAYAVTVHKSQGSEFGTVIMPIVRAQGRMLQRNLFYTAVTRARQKVWLLGDPFAVSRAVANDRVVQRNTVLGREISLAVEAAAGVGGDHGQEENAPARAADG